jgi:site-specific recombinase XerD
VWHTTRHEFISRVGESQADPNVTQELSRIKDFKTVKGYLHTRRERLLAAAAGLERGR